MKEYLSRKRISYIEHDLSKEGDITFLVMQESGRNVAKKIVQMGGQMGVPVIPIDDDVVVNFDQILLNILLGGSSTKG